MSVMSHTNSTVKVEVNRSRETAGRITERETQRIAALNPDMDDLGACAADCRLGRSLGAGCVRLRSSALVALIRSFPSNALCLFSARETRLGQGLTPIAA